MRFSVSDLGLAREPGGAVVQKDKTEFFSLAKSERHSCVLQSLVARWNSLEIFSHDSGDML